MTRWLAAARFRPDSTVRRPAPGIVLGGTPTRVLRVTESGDRLLDEIVGTGRVEALTPGGERLLQRMVDAGMLHPQPGPLVSGEVLVIVPAHNHGRHVAEAVVSGFRAGQVVVVDDASTDDTGARATSAGATVIELEENLGPAAARNRGARHTDSEWLIYIDADCAPEPGCLDALLSHFADPTVGAVAPRILGFGDQNVIGRYEQARSPIDMGPKPGPVRPDARVSFVPTAVLAVRRSAFDAVGGFDEGLRFGEDVDFVWRLTRAGWSVRYDSSVVARHHHRRRLLDIARRRWAYGTAAGPLAVRHPDGLAAIRASPWTLGAWLALILGRRWVAAAMVGWSWVGLHRVVRMLPGSARLSGRLVLRGFTGAARPLAAALTRNWAPLTMAAAVARPQLGSRLLTLIAIGKVAEWAERRPDVDPLRFTALAVVDDLLFCGGVWEGCLRARVLGPLLPRTGRPRVGID